MLIWEHSQMSRSRYSQGPSTARVELKAFTEEDVEAFYKLNTSPEVMKYTGESGPESIAAAREAILAYPDFDEVGYGRWACHLKAENRIIGFCGLKYLKDLQEVDLGYRFLPEYWGIGLATETSLAVINFGLTTLSLNRIIGLVLPENVASVRVLEKCGMRFEQEFTYDDQKALLYAIEK
jgi:[ribosomal protein S5]-alanine N-acetyltransferase